MLKSKIIKGGMFAVAAIIIEDKSKDNKDLCRPSELPLYTKDVPVTLQKTSPQDEGPSAIENAITSVRQNVTNFYKEIKAYQKVGEDYIDQSKDNLDWLLKYLRQEDNTTPKAGAIAIGGLTGLVLGLRGGLIKRTLYAATGALAMASICYPKEAAEYSQTAIVEGKKYATIGYNFIYGVKADDPALELPSLPKLPSSFSEAWDSVSKSATSFVSGRNAEETSVKQIDNQKEIAKSDKNQPKT